MTLNDKINLGESLAHTFYKVMLAHNKGADKLNKLIEAGISRDTLDLVSHALRPSILGAILEIILSIYISMYKDDSFFDGLTVQEIFDISQEHRPSHSLEIMNMIAWKKVEGAEEMFNNIASVLALGIEKICKAKE